MNRFFRRGARPLDVEAELRASRPEPRPELLASIAESVSESTARRPRRFRTPRLVLAGGLTAAALAGVATAGGFEYAATAAKGAFDGVKSVLIGSSSSDGIDVRGLSAGGDQYQPGFAWGDPNRNHDGAPGLVRSGNAFAPPLVASCDGATARVAVRIVLDEQADLALSVIGSNGKKLLLNQKQSSVGQGLTGPQTKTIRYRVLVPRVMRIVLSIPCGLLDGGSRYRIVITATDPDGQSSTLRVPFLASGNTA